jgi:hypothetical protein
MNPITLFVKRHSLSMGIFLMFLFTWPIMLAVSGVLPIQVPFIFALLVGYGIVLATLLMTWLTLGRNGVIALLKRYLIWLVVAIVVVFVAGPARLSRTEEKQVQVLDTTVPGTIEIGLTQVTSD